MTDQLKLPGITAKPEDETSIQRARRAKAHLDIAFAAFDRYKLSVESCCPDYKAIHEWQTERRIAERILAGGE